MAAPPPPKETQWKPGQSGNPGGRPVAARTRLTAAFLNKLAEDFDTHGKKAIENCRKDNPAAYIKAIAALCPKEIELKRPMEDMATEELIAALNALTSYLASQGDQSGTGEAGSREQALELPTVQ